MTTPAIRTVAHTVECALCGAYPGERCSGENGTRARDPHRIRIRTAYQKGKS